MVSRLVWVLKHQFSNQNSRLSDQKESSNDDGAQDARGQPLQLEDDDGAQASRDATVPSNAPHPSQCR